MLMYSIRSPGYRLFQLFMFCDSVNIFASVIVSTYLLIVNRLFQKSFNCTPVHQKTLGKLKQKSSTNIYNYFIRHLMPIAQVMF